MNKHVKSVGNGALSVAGRLDTLVQGVEDRVVNKFPEKFQRTYSNMQGEQRTGRIVRNAVFIGGAASFTPIPGMGAFMGFRYALKRFYARYFCKKEEYTRRFKIDECAPSWSDESPYNLEAEGAYQEYLKR